MSPRATRWLGLGAALAAFGLLAAHFAFTADDGYISFRYARNLAEGRGLVFNPGETPRVEGYSNFLWTLLLSGLYRLGATGTALAPAANAVSIACGALLLALVARAAERCAGASPPAAALSALLLGALPAFGLWSTGGLETMAFSLALFAVAERLELGRTGPLPRGRPLQAGAAAALAVLLRADGFLWLAALLACLVAGALARRERAPVRALATATGVAALALAAHFAWRHAYYGEWLPNTARVKTGFSALRLERGLKYVAAQALSIPALALVPLLRLGTRGAERAARGAAAPAGGMLLFAALYSVHVGGDFMPMGRFLVPALPFAALLAASALTDLERRGPLRAPLAAGALAVLGLAVGLDRLPLPQTWLDALHFRWNSPEARSEHAQWQLQRDQARRWAALGRALALHTQPGESIIRGPVGAVGYFTELELLDLNGLVTLEVARRETPPQRVSPGHDKHVSPDFFFRWKPTYLGAVIQPVGASDSEDLSPEVQEILRRGLAVRECHRLKRRDGFAPGLEVCLFRFRWP